MTYIAIGLIVGLIMGLTGAGGALISIPLFLGFLGISLKEATVLSLAAVVLGTAVNLIGQVKKISLKIAVSLSFAGVFANYITLPLKAKTPEIVIAGFLTAIGLYSVFSVWNKKAESPIETKEDFSIGKSLLSGFTLGIITTFTGLGGGVILIPILIRIFGKSYAEALPTSLSTILLVSLASFIFQSTTALSLITSSQLGLIGAGAVLAAVGLKLILKKFPVNTVTMARKIVFTGVTIYSIMTVLLKAL